MKISIGTANFGLEYGIKKNQISKDEINLILDYGIKNNINYIDTAHSYGNCEKILGQNDLSQFLVTSKYLIDSNTNYNKVASAMITDLDLLDHIAKEKKHTFISTGMTSLSEIDDAVKIFKDNECPFELMHCVSTYPMKPELANLKTIAGLKKRYNCNVGYSGHESGVAVSIAAAVMGISSLERHITLDRAMYGSDQSASLEPRGMRELFGALNVVMDAVGEDKTGHFFEEEIPIAKKLRAHIVKKK